MCIQSKQQIESERVVAVTHPIKDVGILFSGATGAVFISLSDKQSENLLAINWGT